MASVLMLACWFAWYVARERYHLTSRQLAELATYLVIAVSGFTVTAVLLVTRRSRREREWPHPPFAFSRRHDEQIVKEAWRRNAVVLGTTFTVNRGIGPTRYVSCKGSCWA